MSNPDQLDKLIQTVANSAKYKHMSVDLIRQVAAQELPKRRSLKEAVKATKNKLHQVGGAYFDRSINYKKALKLLDNTAVSNPIALQQTCCQIMSLHASTRERLPILDEFYAQILSDLPPIHSVVDLACGLNPLAIPWMPLAEDVTYTAYDIYGDMIDFVTEFMVRVGVNGRAHVCDIVSNPPMIEADLVLLLKSVPCLEQVDKTAVSRLLDQIHAPYVLISFPARSLGGHSKGMVANYSTRFEGLMNGRGWTSQRFQFDTELAFLVETSDG